MSINEKGLYLLGAAPFLVGMVAFGALVSVGDCVP